MIAPKLAYRGAFLQNWRVGIEGGLAGSFCGSPVYWRESWDVMRKILLLAALGLFAVGAPALAQNSAPERTGDAPGVVPGFEKVHAKLKKREAAELKDIARAEQDGAAADAMRLGGENQVAESLSMIDARIAAYKAMAARIGGAQTSADAFAEAKAFEDLAKSWEDAEAVGARGQKMIAKAVADRAAADQRAVEAKARLDEIRLGLSRATYGGAAAPSDAGRAVNLAPVEESAPAEISAEKSAPKGKAPTPNPAPNPASNKTKPDPKTAAPPQIDEPADDELLGGPDERAPFLKK